MNTNGNIIKGRWLELKGELQKTWGKITDDELEKTKGDLKEISGIIQQRYGEAQDISSAKLAKIFKRFEEAKDSAVHKMKKTIKSK